MKEEKKFYRPRAKQPQYDGELIYGRHPVLEALEGGRQFDKVLLLQGTRGELEKSLRKTCKERAVPLVMVPKEKLQRLVGRDANHQGVVGIISPIQYQEFEDVLPLVYEKGEMPLVVLLDGVTDVRNLGAIARSVEASGGHALILPKSNSATVTAEAMKTAAGAFNYLPVCRVQSLEPFLDILIDNGFSIIAADIRGEKMLAELDFSGPTALIMGAEDRGVSPHLLRKTSHCFRIPMLGQSNSFNVSVATGIVLYESMRQRLL